MGLKRKDDSKDFGVSVTDYKLITNEDGKRVYVSVSEAEDIEALRKRRQQVTSFKPLEPQTSTDTEVYFTAVEGGDEVTVRRTGPKRRTKLKDISYEVKAKAPPKTPGYFGRTFQKRSKVGMPKSLNYTDYRLVVTPNGKKVYVSPEEAEVIDIKRRMDEQTIEVFQKQAAEVEVASENLEVPEIFKMVDDLETPEEICPKIVEQDLPAAVRTRGKRPSLLASFLKRRPKTQDDGLSFEKLEEKTSVREEQTLPKRGMFSWLFPKSKVKPAVSEGDLKSSPKLQRHFSLPVIWKKGRKEESLGTTHDEVISDKGDKKRFDNQPSAVLGLMGIFGSNELVEEAPKKKKKVKKGVRLIGEDVEVPEREVVNLSEESSPKRTLLSVFGSGDLKKQKEVRSVRKPREKPQKRNFKELFGSHAAKKEKEVGEGYSDEEEVEEPEQSPKRDFKALFNAQETKKKSQKVEVDAVTEEPHQREQSPKRVLKFKFITGVGREKKIVKGDQNTLETNELQDSAGEFDENVKNSPKHTKKTKELLGSAEDLAEKPKNSKKHTKKTKELHDSAEDLAGKPKNSKKHTKKTKELPDSETDSDDSSEEDEAKTAKKSKKPSRKTKELLTPDNEKKSFLAIFGSHGKSSKLNKSISDKPTKKQPQNAEESQEGSEKPSENSLECVDVQNCDVNAEAKSDDKLPKKVKNSKKHTKKTKELHDSEEDLAEKPKNSKKHAKKTKELQDSAEVLPEKPKNSKKNTKKTKEPRPLDTATDTDGSSEEDVVKKAKNSRKKPRKTRELPTSAAGNDKKSFLALFGSHGKSSKLNKSISDKPTKKQLQNAEDSQEESENSLKESADIHNHTDDAYAETKSEEKLPKQAKNTKKRDELQDSAEKVSENPKNSKKHTKKTPQLRPIDTATDSDDSNEEDIPKTAKNSKKQPRKTKELSTSDKNSFLAIFGSHSKSSKLKPTKKFGSAPTVYEPKNRKSILSVFEKQPDRQSLPSEGSLTSVDTNQEVQTGFYNLETTETLYNLRSSYPAGLWGPRKRSRTDFCYLGDEPERVQAPEIVLRGFKTFDDDGKTLLRGKNTDRKQRPLSYHHESVPKVLSVRRFSDCKMASDTESADHGSTDKTSVTKLTQDDKKRKFNFMELIKRGKDKEPAVVAEVPKEIVTEATNGDRVVYAELDMVRGVEASAALRRDNDPDKTEYAEIIHPNPPMSKKEELRRSRENLVDPSAEPATPSGKKEAAV